MALFTTDVVIAGGCGHVGLPLGIVLADAGLDVALYDINADAVATVNSGELPFRERDADVALKKSITDGKLVATTSPSVIATAEIIIVVIGTPVEEHLEPDLNTFLGAVAEISKYLHDGQLLVLRSTVIPGVTNMVEEMIEKMDIKVDVAFCPERIAEGHAMRELHELPQIVASRSDEGTRRAEELFRNLTKKIVYLNPEEAELAKLFTNVWRYVKFAMANQFYMMANDQGLDFERIRAALAQDYPRAKDLPRAGFAAGPCLVKDTLRLAAFDSNNFPIGHAALMVNEGLPRYVVSRLHSRYDLSSMTVGILGMAFKAHSDDNRSSLSYTLKRILTSRAAEVLTTDPFVTVDPELISLEAVAARADLLIIAAPHHAYASLETNVPIIDIWNVRDEGVRI